MRIFAVKRYQHMTHKKIIVSLLSLLVVLGVNAQMVDPVHFTSELKTGNGMEAEIVFHATIDNGWHVYSTEIGENGPTEATFNVVKMEGAELIGKLIPKGKVIKKMDKLFDMELKYFENEVTFVQKLRFTKPEYDIDCYLEYGACSDASCLPPSEVELKQKGKSPSISAPAKTKEATPKTETIIPQTEETTPVTEEVTAKTDTTTVAANVAPTEATGDLWEPVVEELRELGSGEDLAKHLTSAMRHPVRTCAC